MNTTQVTVSAGIPAFIISDYVLSTGVDAPVAERRAREVEKFLRLCAKSQSPLVPSVAVDDFWHEFILHTRDYAAFCSKNFGRFIHHNPKRGADAGLRDAYLRTVAAIEREFGSVDETVWPVLKATDCNSDGSDGGGCDGDQAIAKAQCDSGGEGGPGGCDGDGAIAQVAAQCDSAGEGGPGGCDGDS